MKFSFPIREGYLSIVSETSLENAPTIIFLHDALGCVKTWRDFPKQLAQKAECNYVIYDRLGYGESAPDSKMLHREKDYLHQEAEILIDILTQLKIAKPILFGHSDGASIALIAAAKLPDFLGIILEAPHIFVEDLTLDGIRAVKKRYEETDLKQKLMRYHASKTDAVFYAWANTWLHPNFRSWNIEALLPQINCPALIIQGETDEFASLKQVDGILKGIPSDTRKEILKHTGHTPHKENEEETLRLSVDFIKML